jgi:hypothetical protein
MTTRMEVQTHTAIRNIERALTRSTQLQEYEFLINLQSNGRDDNQEMITKRLVELRGALWPGA